MIKPKAIKTIYLLDRSLKVDVYFEPDDLSFKDNICVSICEDCPDSEKIFIADETNIYLSAEESKKLGEILLAASDESVTWTGEQK